MEIAFADSGFQAQCNEQRELVRRQGVQRAKVLRRRLDDLAAAPTLDAMRVLPGRCHELRGDRAGVLSIDLDGPYRLLFRPGNSLAPRKSDGGLDWKQVTQIIVLGIENTHE